MVGNDAKPVTFFLKHYTARVRFKVLAYTPEIHNATCQLTSTELQPTAFIFDVSTESAGANAWGTIETYPRAITQKPLRKDTKFVQANVFMSDYEYLLPETKSDKVDFEIHTGTAYGNSSLVGKKLTLKVLGEAERNHSYTVQVKLKPTLYLFQDGSVGVLAEKDSRTPIAAVVKEKTNTEEGIAMALNTTEDFPITPSGGFNKQKLSIADATKDMQGYYYTWNGESTPDGKVKATAIDSDNKPIFETFYAAAHYNPGIATTNIGKWYLPALGEWRLALKELGKVDISTISGSSVYNLSPIAWDKSVMEKVFTPVGGTALNRHITRETSTMYDDFQLAYYLYLHNKSIEISSESFNSHLVVPFVHF